MASPKWHVFPKAGMTIISGVLYTPLLLFSKGTLIISLVIFLSFFTDLDHIGLIFLEKIKDKNWLIRLNKQYYLHTWPALLVILALSIYLISSLPFISYAIHILIDGGNIAGLSVENKAYLPKIIHRFYPPWLIYDYVYKERGKK